MVLIAVAFVFVLVAEVFSALSFGTAAEHDYDPAVLRAKDFERRAANVTSGRTHPR